MDLLAAGEVHLFYAFADEFKHSAEFQKGLNLLSVEERIQYGKYAFEKDKVNYLLARYVLRTKLSEYFPVINPENWQFKFNRFGRPSISNENAPKNLYFNLSHAGEMVVAAFASVKEIGVDVERKDRVCSYLDLAEHCFSDLEIQKLKSNDAKDYPVLFFNFWTLKEAYIKARGMGLALPLAQFSFVINSNNDIQIIFDNRMNEDASRWSFRLIDQREAYQLAVAVAAERPLKIRETSIRFP